MKTLIRHPVSSIQHPVSNIQHPVSSTRHLLFLLILLLGSSFSGVSAQKVPGFIITHDGQKINGTVQLTRTSEQGGIYFDNINVTPLYNSVYFKNSQEGSFTEYFPEDIDGFGFLFKDAEISFFSMDVPFHSLGKVYRKTVFLRLVVDGELVLFDHRDVSQAGQEKYSSTDYYIVDTSNVIHSVTTENIHNLKRYLVQEVKMDKAFLDALHYSIKIRNLKDIITDYNQRGSKDSREKGKPSSR